MLPIGDVVCRKLGCLPSRSSVRYLSSKKCLTESQRHGGQDNDIDALTVDRKVHKATPILIRPWIDHGHLLNLLRVSVPP